MSILGFGCMRFKRRNGQIDMVEAEKEILYGIENGVNYFDTAYIYTGSEVALGTILAKNQCREQVMIATKLPQYLIKSQEKMDVYFNEQLRRLQTDYIDYYLMHMLPDVATWEQLKALGILEWIAEKKASGAIRNIGFSYHGNTQHFQELIDAYDWDFCQIQYNYMDEHSQAGRKGLYYAANKGIPVFIMEPLRGGRLVNGLPKKALEAFSATGLNRTPAEWALRWLWNQKEVTCVLSGMNSLAMIEENMRIASEVQVGEITANQVAVFERVKEEINAKMKIGCTGCGYCLPCPKGVDIPGSFRCYDVRFADGYINGFREYLMCTSMRVKKSNASLCVDCGKCESHCPQAIPIRKQLKNVVKMYETPLYK
ncbi:MAG TPA: aldo/keto reductase, partial [Firmicutes bacterium]|nr:aldo/keto reductase [Bacillota bacterium]